MYSSVLLEVLKVPPVLGGSMHGPAPNLQLVLSPTRPSLKMSSEGDAPVLLLVPLCSAESKTNRRYQLWNTTYTNRFKVEA